jgi:hypothetical protein
MESIEKLGEQLEAIENRARMMERRLRWWRILTCGLVVLGLVILPLAGGTAAPSFLLLTHWTLAGQTQHQCEILAALRCRSG